MAGGPSDGPEVTEVIECPKELVGKVIGKMGATIKDLQLRSNTRIQVRCAVGLCVGGGRRG